LNALESFLYEVSKLFLTPVLAVLCAMFVFSLFSVGTLLFDLVLRTARGRGRTPLGTYAQSRPDAGQEELELRLLKLIEPLRLTSRVAPMLGLVATMIPMGPALVAVSSGNAGGIAQNLVVAFSAVIVALTAASIAYVVLSVRRRWLLEELHALLDAREAALSKPAAGGATHTLGVANG
jgi:biopolymer transport protein ExbB/TolQ